MKTPIASQSDEFIPRPLKKIAPYFLLVLAVFAAYGNIYDNAFLYDDESLILKNVFLQDWHSLSSIFTTSITAGANISGGFYRPLQITLYLIIFQLAGLSLFGFHILNVILHAANACLVYRLGCRLRFRPTGCFFAALLWALHPVNVEAVTYISATADPLYLFFCLWALNILVPRLAPSRFLFAVPLLILALLSKEEAIVFPLLAMSCIFYLDKDRFQPKAYVRTLPLWIVAAGYLICHKFFLSFGGFQIYRADTLYSSSILCRLYTCLAALPSYFGFLVWPVHLHFDRDFQPVTDPWHLNVIAGLLMVAVAIVVVVYGHQRKMRPLSWGILWFAVADILHTGILIPVNAILLEHWLYVPSIGIFLGAAQSIAAIKPPRWRERKPLGIILGSMLALLLGVLTWRQNNVWHDGETFYLNIFKNGEPSPHAHNNLGVLYTMNGEYAKAVEQYELSIELSGDTNAQAHHDLAITLLNGPNGRAYRQEAIKHFQRALEIDPNYYPADTALAAIYEQMGNKERAGIYRQRAEAALSTMRTTPAH